MISGDGEDTAKTENDDSLFRPSVTERSSPGSFEPATDSKGRNHMVRSLNLHICPSGSGSQEGTPPDRSCLATVHSSLSTFCLLSDDFRQTEPCQEISAGWSFHNGLTTGSSGISKATSSKCVSAEKCAVQVMPYVETSDHFVTGEIAGKVEGNDDIEEEWKTTASADTKLDEEIIYCDRHTQDNDAKNIAETLIELSNTKHTSAVKKTRGCPTNTGTGNERKLMKSAHHSEHSHNEYDIVNETQKQRNRDEYTTEIAETLIGMKTIDSPPVLTKVPYESPTKAAQTCNNQRGSERSDVTWNRRLIELRQFKELHGHTNVPQKYEKNPSLGSWVARNRLFMRQWEEDPNSCSAYQVVRMKALKEVGLVSGIGKGGFGRTTGVFLSSRNARDWENQFQCLREYRAMFGNCDVPVKSETHRSLGRWISAQRRKYQQYISKDSNAKPSNDLLHRFQRLKDIGFNFSIGSGNAKREKGANAIGLSFEISYSQNGSTHDEPNQDGLHRSNAPLKNSIPQSQTKYF